MKPVKIDDIYHQALKEHSVFLGRDMGDVVQDALSRNAAFKKTYDEVASR
jgi:hypothetical protein